MSTIDDPDRAVALSRLGYAQLKSFERTGKAHDLEVAIMMFWGAVEATPAGDVNRGGRLANFGTALLTSYEQTEKAAELDRAVEVLEEAVRVTPTDHPARALGLTNMTNSGIALLRRFERTENAEDLDRAIGLLENALAASGLDDAHRPLALSNLRGALRSKLRQAESATDLEHLIELLEGAVAATPSDDPDRASVLYDLGVASLRYFERAGREEDLDRAVAAVEDAVAATRPEDPSTARYLSFLSAALQRVSQTAGAADLDRAIAVAEDAVAGIPLDDIDWVGAQSNLGAALLTRFKRTGNLTDLERAIEVLEEAAAATPSDDPFRAPVMSNLGAARMTRYLRTGSAADLNRGIADAEEAVAATQAGDPDRFKRLSTLGIALRMRWARTGNVADLDGAIEVQGEAAAAISGDSPYGPEVLSNLGAALVHRFDRLGSAADLDRAIEVLEDAEAVSSTDHPQRVNVLINYGLALRLRFHRTGNLADLDQAITLGNEALAATTMSHPAQSQIRINLGLALETRFEETGRAADLNRAVELSEDAVGAIPEDDPERVVALSGLAGALTRRGNVADLARAIELLETAVATTPDDQAARATYLVNLGSTLGELFERLRRSEDYERGVEVLREATELVSAPLDARALAAKKWGGLAVAAGRWDEAVDGYTAAVGLRGLVAARWLSRADQEHRLRGLAGLGPEAAAACLQAEQPDAAVELLEQGRAVLFSQMLDTRSDLTDLATAHPQVAAEFVRLRDELDRPVQPTGALFSGSDGDPIVTAQLHTDQRRETAASFKEVIEQIQRLPKFERFLQPLPITELLSAAADGPVVMINIAPLRSDALILPTPPEAPTTSTSSGVDVVPLPDVSPAAVAAQVIVFLDALDDARHTERAKRDAGEERLGAVLGWVWDRVTGPVLDHLGISATPSEGDKWPRVWWCPTGPLAMLPLHAAGHHHTSSDQAPDTVNDRVVSSTLPTLRALIHSRQATTTPSGSGDWRVLVVAMPRTPNQRDLPGAEDEARLLTQLFPRRVDILGLPDTPPATFSSVATALPTHRWVHFSCHGTSDLNDPSTSHLLLDGDPLTVLDLTRARLQHAELAFLSACTTARTGAALPDEPIHLASACQLAGYRHVIATLWSIGDADAARVTNRIYRTLATQPDAGGAAIALHAATRQQRAFYPRHPSRWATHTHAGP